MQLSSRFLLISGFILCSAGQALGQLPQEYERFLAEEKQDFLWKQRIVPSAYKSLPQESGGTWDRLLGAAGSLFSLAQTFNHVSDEMPQGRKKFIHTYGTVAACSFEPTADSPYTGLFKGAPCLVRLSLAGDPAMVGYTPGAALKFFISGLPSRNIMIMPSVNGQGDNWNYFAHPFSNILPEAEGFHLQVIQQLFATAHQPPNHLPLTHLSTHTRHGNVEATSKAPYQIIAVAPTSSQIDPNTDEDFRVTLRRRPEKGILFYVYARSSKYAESTWIGTIKQESAFIASKYGDEHLFFKHQSWANPN